MKVLIPESSEPSDHFGGSWTSWNLTGSYKEPLDRGSHTRVCVSTSGRAWWHIGSWAPSPWFLT